MVLFLIMLQHCVRVQKLPADKLSHLEKNALFMIFNFHEEWIKIFEFGARRYTSINVHYHIQGAGIAVTERTVSQFVYILYQSF